MRQASSKSSAAASEVRWAGGKARVFTLGLVGVMSAFLIVFVAAAKPAHAEATFIVNTTSDHDPGPCQLRVPDFPSLDCTLREAINAANSNNNPDETDAINFNIPTTDPNCNATTNVCTISPTSGLPTITQPVTIDGYTQRPCSTNPAPCSKPNPSAEGTNAVLLIELSGANIVQANGFTITGGGTTIRGMVINGFKEEDGALQDGVGILMLNVAGNTNNVIEGNFICTDPSGTIDLGNEVAGVAFFTQCTGNRVGGPDREDRNLISGNRDGVVANSSSNTIQGNLIGTDKSGTADLGNAVNGTEVSGLNNVATNNRVAFNDGTGVVFSGTGNRVVRNSIFSNGGLGIDLSQGDFQSRGPTANPEGTSEFSVPKNAR